MRSAQQRLMAQVPGALAHLLELPKTQLKVRRSVAEGEGDLVVSAGRRIFLVEVKARPTPGNVAEGAERIAKAAKKHRPKAIPLFVAPFMNDTARRVCESADVPWLDLSGNARIIAPGLRIIVDGRPNRFRGPGRPASVFAPKSARIVRWLLTHPGAAFTQREIARETGMTEGFVSRIVSRLEEERYITRLPTPKAEPGAPQAKLPIGVRDPDLLLDAWREEYLLDRHQIVRGHIAARSGDALARFLSDALTAEGVDNAATGLAAAWQMTHFAGFRITTFFLAREPPEDLKKRLGFRDEPKGANTWLIIPNDEGVFQGAADVDGMRCVHPVQVYLDLKGLPERAPEAAEHLRSYVLKWKQNA